MGIALSEQFRKMLKDKSYAQVATIMPDGSPQVTLVWVDTDGRNLLINTTDGNRKVRNVRRDDRVAMTVTGPGQSAAHVQVRGRVVEITREGATEHVEELSQQYHGGPYPLHHLGQRVILKVEPLRIREMMMGDPRDRDGASANEDARSPSKGG